MEKSPTISVIMSVYKEPLEWLRQSIDSILKQTFTEFEFIIICDNPQYEEGISLLNEYAQTDSRIMLIYNDINIGLTKSLNKGLAIAKGKYIARMDADDISALARFSIEVDFLNRNVGADVCHSNFHFIDDDGVVKKQNVVPVCRTDQDLLFCRNIVGHSTVMFRRELLNLRNPLYNENYRSAQDYELWTFLSLCGRKICFIDKPLLLYRVSVNQVSAKRFKEQHDNTYKMRREYIISYLSSLNICNPNENDPIAIYTSINNYYDGVSDLMKRNLSRILYVIYYTLACKKSKFVLKFLFDKRMHIIKLEGRDYLRIILAPIIGNKYNAMKL